MAEIFRGRSDWFLDAKQFPKARECAEASIAWRPTADAYIDKGVALRKLKRLQEAVAASTDPDDLKRLLQRGGIGASS